MTNFTNCKSISHFSTLFFKPSVRRHKGEQEKKSYNVVSFVSLVKSFHNSRICCRAVSYQLLCSDQIHHSPGVAEAFKSHLPPLNVTLYGLVLLRGNTKVKDNTKVIARQLGYIWFDVFNVRLHHRLTHVSEQE